jgi:hypothetical protein
LASKDRAGYVIVSVLIIGLLGVSFLAAKYPSISGAVVAHDSVPITGMTGAPEPQPAQGYKWYSKDGSTKWFQIRQQDYAKYANKAYEIVDYENDDGYTVMQAQTNGPQIIILDVDMRYDPHKLYTDYSQNLLTGNREPTTVTGIEGQVFEQKKFLEQSIRIVNYEENNKPRITEVYKDGNSYKVIVTTYDCGSPGICPVTTESGTTQNINDIYDQGRLNTGFSLTAMEPVPVTQSQVTKYTEKLTEMKKFGVTGTKIGLDGTSELSTANGKFEFMLDSTSQQITYTTKDGKTVKINEGGLFGGSVLDGGSLKDNCKNKAKHCLVISGVEHVLNDAEYQGIKNPYELREGANDLFVVQYSRPTFAQVEYANNYYRQMETLARGRITQILNSYLNEILGPFSQGVPAAICGDRIYKKDTTTKKEFGWPLGIPQTTYGSEMERKIWEDLRTVTVFGSVKELSDSMYRYEVNLKLIGDKTSPTWELYLYNSCSKNNSKSFWMDKGQLSNLQVFQMMYAGQEGEDMIFECDLDPGCRFDQACLKLSDELAPRCFALAGTITNSCQ